MVEGAETKKGAACFVDAEPSRATTARRRRLRRLRAHSRALSALALAMAQGGGTAAAPGPHAGHVEEPLPVLVDLVAPLSEVRVEHAPLTERVWFLQDLPLVWTEGAKFIQFHDKDNSDEAHVIEGCITPTVDLLMVTDAKVLGVALDGLENMPKLGKRKRHKLGTNRGECRCWSDQAG